MGSFTSKPATRTTTTTELDALIVGAGFGGVYQLKTLRDQGYHVRLVERGSDYGGVWHANRYPGARVDSAIPVYEFSDPALWREWTWTQRFPGSEELRAYFAYVAKKWDLRKDTDFNTSITSATWSQEECRWTVLADSGQVFKAKYFLLSTGFASKRHIPEWKGIETFQGTFLHPGFWPTDGLDLHGKRVAVIGTGSTGIQLAHAIAPTVAKLAVFQRTPNTSLPMGQVDFPAQQQQQQQRQQQQQQQMFPKDQYPAFFHGRTSSYGGFDFNFLPRNTFDDAPATRQHVYEQLWAAGDFQFWLANYQDMLFAQRANDEAYRFWRDKTRARIRDPRARELLAPLRPPYALGTKRISLENGYFEIFDRDNVHLVDVNATPIEEVTAAGIRTSEREWAFDYIICATGYDAVTGGLTQIDIRGASGESLKEHWKDGVYTYLGMSCAGFPNMFFTYGPQAPTALCNGPTCAELQGDWISGVLKHMASNGLQTIEADRASEEKWRQTVADLANASLLPTTNSWYMGSNIPGKPREPYIYLGGVPNFYKALQDSADNGFAGFTLK